MNKFLFFTTLFLIGLNAIPKKIASIHDPKKLQKLKFNVGCNGIGDGCSEDSECCSGNCFCDPDSGGCDCVH